MLPRSSTTIDSEASPEKPASGSNRSLSSAAFVCSIPAVKVIRGEPSAPSDSETPSALPSVSVPPAAARATSTGSSPASGSEIDIPLPVSAEKVSGVSKSVCCSPGTVISGGRLGSSSSISAPVTEMSSIPTHSSPPTASVVMKRNCTSSRSAASSGSVAAIGVTVPVPSVASAT